MGDSLTEGIGTSRISYVAELLRLIRQKVEEGELPATLRANLIRLRPVDPSSHSRFVVFNQAGFIDKDEKGNGSSLWLWNLACEGKTIDTDKQLVAFLETISPSVIVIFRGSLESIIRPATLHNNNWPMWIPSSWRGYAAMDPRCYFSTTWWRKLKQWGIDALKQKARMQLLAAPDAEPLINIDTLLGIYQDLLTDIKRFKARVIVVGMLPVSATNFPKSDNQFQLLNNSLRTLAKEEGVEFLDWGRALESRTDKDSLYYRDGFHPNAEGARFLAREMFECLFGQAA